MSFAVPFRHGDHACVVYESQEEHIAVAARFLADGLRVAERCLYSGYSPEALSAFRVRLRLEGIDAEAEEVRGALVLLTKDEAHLVEGRFDSERMLRMLSAAVEEALDAGYSGFRCCGDMTWLLDCAPGSSQVVEYEALVTQLFRTVRALCICLYDRRRLPPELIDHALATHPSVIVGAHHRPNPFFLPTELATTRQPQPSEVARKLSELRRRG